jgi:hypothetical protein
LTWKSLLAQAEDGSWPASEAEVELALHTLEELLRDRSVPLPPAVVVDVGQIEGQGWAVVEANAAWGSGLYGCDPIAVLDVLRRASVKRNAVSEEDRPWVIDRGGAA